MNREPLTYAEAMQEQYERALQPVDYAKRLADLFASLEQNLAENEAGTFKE